MTPEIEHRFDYNEGCPGTAGTVRGVAHTYARGADMPDSTQGDALPSHSPGARGREA